MTDTLQTCEYHVDARNCICRIGGCWDAFARDNETPALLENVVGRPLFDFIDGPDVQLLYHMLVDRVRTGGEPLAFPYRCDAPGCRRFMRMEIRPGPEDHLLFFSTVVRQEAREAIPLLAAAVDRSEEKLPICSWCKKVRLSETDWGEVEDAIATLDLFAAAHQPLPILTHTICPGCDKTMRQKFGLTRRAG